MPKIPAVNFIALTCNLKAILKSIPMSLHGVGEPGVGSTTNSCENRYSVRDLN